MKFLSNLWLSICEIFQSKTSKPKTYRYGKITDPITGECHTGVEWSRKLGGNDSLVSGRIHAGWPVNKAIRTHVKHSYCNVPTKEPVNEVHE